MPSSSPRRFELLVDDDGVSHQPWLVNENGRIRPELDYLGWYDALCGLKHPGPLVLCASITCIECLVQHAENSY